MGKQGHVLRDVFACRSGSSNWSGQHFGATGWIDPSFILHHHDAGRADDEVVKEGPAAWYVTVGQDRPPVLFEWSQRPWYIALRGGAGPGRW